MVLLHLCTLILLLLYEDMQVSKLFELLIVYVSSSMVIVCCTCYLQIPICFIFADVVIHRLLAASIGISKLPAIFQDRPQLTSIADSKYTLTLMLSYGG